jgi:hypothetical protein
MSLRSAISMLAVVERGIAVDIQDGPAQGYSAQAVAYESTPPSRDALSYPAFMNFSTLTESLRRPGGWRQDSYEVTVQCIVGPSSAEADVKGDIALALWDEFLSTFDRHLALTEVAHQWKVRGSGTEMPTTLEWNGVGYIGWECLLDLSIRAPSNFGLGEN